MDDPDEVARFYDRCSDLMRGLLDALAAAPEQPRAFARIEDALGWPHRRIASVLGGVSHLRHTEFGGRRPYRFHDERHSRSGRWELWMDEVQAGAVQAERRRERADSGRGPSIPGRTGPQGPTDAAKRPSRTRRYSVQK